MDVDFITTIHKTASSTRFELVSIREIWCSPTWFIWCCVFGVWIQVWPGGYAMLHRAGMKSRLTREQSQSQPCHLYISERVCCSVCCSLKHEWNAVWASMLFSRWCQLHACTFPLLADCTLRPPVCPSWLSLQFASRHQPSQEGICFANPYLTDSRKGAHLAWGISVRQSGARNAAGNSVTCVSYCCHPAIITHTSPNYIFVLFSKK